MDENPQELNRIYKVNPGRSFFAESVSKQGATSIRNNIAASLTKEFTEAVFAQISDLGAGFSQAADGSAKLVDGIVKVQEGNHEVTANLHKLSASILTFSDGAAQMETAVCRVLTGAVSLNDEAVQLNDVIQKYTAGVDSLKAGVDKFAAIHPALHYDLRYLHVARHARYDCARQPWTVSGNGAAGTAAWGKRRNIPDGAEQRILQCHSSLHAYDLCG